MAKIMLIEDSTDVVELIKLKLGDSNDLRVAENLARANTIISDWTPQLILLDITLPDGDGYQFCAKMKQDDRLKKIPVLFMTARAGFEDKAMAFKLGADDFIQKPFDVRELKLRIESKILKIDEEEKSHDWLQKGDLKIHISHQKAFLISRNGNESLDLTPLEFKILNTLARREGQIFKREQLLKNVWGENIYQSDRTIDRHICSLRKKMGHYSKSIRSVYGCGYVFSLEHLRAQLRSG